MQAVIDGKTILAGNTKLMEKAHIKYTPSSAVGTVVYLACDGKYALRLRIKTQERKEKEKGGI